VIFALLVGVGVLFFLFLRAQTTADTNERNIRLLVEALGIERFDWDRAAQLPDGPRLVTISPAFNEAENVAGVIKQIPAMLEGHHVIPVVVSDGSTDRTAAVAREAGALVAELPIRRGGGLALRVGYEIALRLHADLVVTLDADGQHLPSEMERLVEPVLSGKVDVAHGSRVLGAADSNHLAREMGIVFFNRVVSFITRTHVTDCSNGYRAVRADVLPQLVLRQEQFHTSEFLIEAIKRGIPAEEVPVTVVKRLHGHSKKPAVLRYGVGFANAIVRTWLR
jgi:glycosyltransferase involved in cell wall biosynthesis